METGAELDGTEPVLVEIVAIYLIYREIRVGIVRPATAVVDHFPDTADAP